MSKQRISVIIPTFNRPSALKHCLRSLAVSDYPHDWFEIIVVNDGSDPPAAVSVPGRLTVRLLHQANAGPSAARNAGAAVASGDLLAFTDDDCEIDPGWLPALATEAASAPGCLLGRAHAQPARDPRSGDPESVLLCHSALILEGEW